MATKIYRPEDSLQVYIDDGINGLKLVTASHLRVYPSETDKVIIRDELLSREVVPLLVTTLLQDEAGAAIGADTEAGLLYLAKIIG